MQARDEVRAHFAEVKARKFLASPTEVGIILGDSHARRWPSNLPVPGHDGPILNLGIGGDRIEDVHWRITKWPLTLKCPKYIVLFIGGNNYVAGEDPPLILKRYSDLVNLIRSQTDCPMYAVGLLPRGKKFWYRPECIVETNRGIQDLSRSSRFNAYFANEALSEHGADEGLRRYYSDYAHLNEEGYKLVAKCLDPT